MLEWRSKAGGGFCDGVSRRHLVRAGGGIRKGVVFGESDGHAAYPVSGAVSPQDVAATIYHCLGIPPDTWLTDPRGQVFQLSDGAPILEVLE